MWKPLQRVVIQRLLALQPLLVENKTSHLCKLINTKIMPECLINLKLIKILFILKVKILVLIKSSPMPRKFPGIISQYPSDSKCSRLNVDISWFCIIHLRYIPYIDSFQMISNSPVVSNCNRFFLEHNQFVHRFS